MGSVREVAAQALKVFDEGTYFKNLKEYRNREYFALVGLLEGIADGTITVGQSWAAELLMGRQINKGESRIEEYDVNDKEAILLKAIFASGICCEGQRLETNNMNSSLRRR
jgi:hypothetical protein